MRERRGEMDNKQKYPKTALLVMLRHKERQKGRYVWALNARTGGHVETWKVQLHHDPRRHWSRDELIGECLDLLFPTLCRWHERIKPCALCAPQRCPNHGPDDICPDCTS
jgi:hypothetical protein